jgi:chromosome partitioning protein
VRTISIINQKGGCGKTTVSINLAAVLASMGRKTLLVDMDPQSHCALGLAVPETQLDRAIGGMLLAGLDGSLAFSDIVWQISRNLDLAPSTMALAGIEQELAAAPDKDRRLAQVLSTVADQYEFCIIDCPPSIGLLTFNALRASDEILIPVETGYFALQGSVRQEATIEMLARRINHNVRFKVLATMYDVRTKLAREILSELRRHFGDKLLPVVVNFNSKLKEAASFGQPITEYDPASRGMADFDKLANWLIANPPAQMVSAGEQAAGGTAANPAMSRAAELVERARALSARTAALAARINSDSDVMVEDAVEPLPMTELPPLPTPTLAPTRSNDKHAEPSPSLTEKLARIYGARVTGQGLLFVQPAPRAQAVCVAGDFNGWSATATPLKRDDRLGVWQACVPVPPGRYRYRLIIDGQWAHDAYNTYVEANPFGELNSVVEVDN